MEVGTHTTLAALETSGTSGINQIMGRQIGRGDAEPTRSKLAREDDRVERGSISADHPIALPIEGLPAEMVRLKAETSVLSSTGTVVERAYDEPYLSTRSCAASWRRRLCRRAAGAGMAVGKEVFATKVRADQERDL